MLSRQFIKTGLLMLYLSATYILFLFLNYDTMHKLCCEDGIFEYLGAFFFLFASLLFFWLFVKSKSKHLFLFIKTKRNFFFLILALLFFMAFGEEISWGQRIFKFHTPELITKVNVQKEFNIHNIALFHGRDLKGERKSGFLSMINIDRLFSLFWFSYCFMLPIIAKFKNRLINFLEKSSLPIMPIWIGVFFMINYVFSKIIEYKLEGHIRSLVTEMKESNFGFLFFISAMYFYIHRSRILGKDAI